MCIEWLALSRGRILFIALLLAGLALRPCAVSAGVFDDCRAWWHFDYDVDNDNLADLNEIRDQLDWGTTAVKGANGMHATGVQGLLGSPQWTNSTALRPAGGREYGGRSMLFRPAVNANNDCWPDTYRVAGLGLAGSATLLTRFRWDGAPTPIELSCWFYNNHLEWNAYRGWLFGIAGGSPKLTLYTQKQTIQSDITITTGVWYDVAMVLTDGGAANPTDTVEYYLWREGGTIQYRKHNSTAITNSINPNPVTIVGSEVFGSGYASGNSRKAFKGEVNHLAVWNRALSYDEVLEAFCFPQPLIQVGVNNTRQDELRIEDETDSIFEPGDPWHTMPRAVKNGKEATFRIPLDAVKTSVDYVFHINTYGTDAPSSTAGIALIVNSTTNKTFTLGRHQEAYWFIPKETLINGINNFTLRYTGGTSAYLTFDWLELGGAWQIGYANLTQTEFSSESAAPDDFYVTDPDWLHMERAMTVGDPLINIHFALSPELASRYGHRYTTRVISQDNGGIPRAFSIGVNDTILYSTPGVPNNTLVSVPIPAGLLTGGMNEINLLYDSTNTSSWVQFDFHRLEVTRYGTLIIIQ